MVTGSITRAHTVLAAGLVDEIRLFVYPAVQGRGKGLVAEGTALPHLELRECKSFRSGVVLLRYAVGGG
jgi:riboflavin biosynthesis pyrimidine reductase